MWSRSGSGGTERERSPSFTAPDYIRVRPVFSHFGSRAHAGTHGFQDLVPGGTVEGDLHRRHAGIRGHAFPRLEPLGPALRRVDPAVIGRDIDQGQQPASVRLKRYAATHPFARISGTDNIFAFKTARYNAQPLVVQGPGAGPDVTAGGVFADLLRLAAYVGGSA